MTQYRVALWQSLVASSSDEYPVEANDAVGAMEKALDLHGASQMACVIALSAEKQETFVVVERVDGELSYVRMADNPRASDKFDWMKPSGGLNGTVAN